MLKPATLMNIHPDWLTTQKAHSKPAQLMYLAINPHIACGRIVSQRKAKILN